MPDCCGCGCSAPCPTSTPHPTPRHLRHSTSSYSGSGSAAAVAISCSRAAAVSGQQLVLGAQPGTWPAKWDAQDRLADDFGLLDSTRGPLPAGTVFQVSFATTQIMSTTACVYAAEACRLLCSMQHFRFVKLAGVHNVGRHLCCTLQAAELLSKGHALHYCFCAAPSRWSFWP